MKKTILMIAVTAACSFSASAKIWRVSNVDNTANFQTLDAAMTSIAAGDTIYLEGSPNEYKLSASITKQVHIVGPGYFLDENPNTLMQKSPAYIASDVTILAKGTTLTGVSLRASSVYSYDLYIGADNVEIRRCRLGAVYFSDKNSVNAIQINNPTIAQCFVSGQVTSSGNDYAYNAIIINNLFASTSNLTYLKSSLIENNTCNIQSQYSYFSFGNNNDCIFKNNICHDIENTNTRCTVLNNYVAGIADYVSGSADGSWQLIETSAAKTAGTSGSECGAFGGASPYVLSGLPSVPHIYEIDAPTAASAASGLKVTLKIGTEQ